MDAIKGCCCLCFVSLYLPIFQQPWSLQHVKDVGKYTCIMPAIITYGNELLRIGAKNRIERSTDGGRNWSVRYTGTSCGEFRDLLPYGGEILAVTSKGIYRSADEGRNWSSRYMSSSCGEFLSLTDNGGEVLATTTKGLYRSKDGGRNWSKK